MVISITFIVAAKWSLLLLLQSILLGQWKNGSDSLLSPEKELAFSFGNRSAVLVELGEYEVCVMS